QLLLLRAAPALTEQAASEAAFLASMRDFERGQDTLAAELEHVRAGHEGTISSICGADFDVTTPADADWQACGSQAGTLAEARLQIDLRHAEVRSAYERLEGLQQRVLIEQQALFDAGLVRDRTVRFLSAAGS